jgi:hypothetical protein
MPAPIKAIKNVTVEYDGEDITPYLNQQSIEAIVNEIDVTNLDSDGAEKIAGLASWTVNVAGLWEKALDDVVGPDMVTPPETKKDLVIVLGKTGAQVTYTWTANAFIGNYRASFDNPTSAATWTGVLAVSGAPTRT